MHYGCIYGYTCNHTSPGPPQSASLPPWSWPGKLLQQSVLHNQRISAQTVRNRLREAHLHARRLHRVLDLTAVCCRNQLELANSHFRWHLALWRGVLFKMKFLKFLRACSRQCRNNLHIDSTYTYRLYRRQCAKYTYIYSAHTVYYKDILSTNTHYTPYVHVYIMYTSIHSNMWRCNRL